MVNDLGFKISWDNLKMKKVQRNSKIITLLIKKKNQLVNSH